MLIQKRILFVCTGNTCRSPMAEALLRNLSKEFHINLEVRSAGTHAYDGMQASEHSIMALQEKGIDHDHRSQAITSELIHWSDLILTMTVGHQSILGQMFPEANEKIYTLKNLAYGAQDGDQDIADPYGGSAKMYQETRDEIEQAIRQLLGKWSSNSENE
ncbi:low molecular weight protein arginine phosphatase [Thermoactinomyces sp. DSM 45892]|uniref:low molecular weight protein arginine phosphatase n=1 Tax=Thermoactinomyces sp. DSM 45892 TaxID=1882753 RepID=UPI000B874197|nr:low molecular weight protein arginine phosphatase [Thermoactinomyces sp. DSM 45892]